MHAITTDDVAFVKFSLSAENASGTKVGQLLLESIGKREGVTLLMDRAYEDNKTREFAKELGFALVVPPKRSRKKTVE
ncbi:transposase, partial [Treponema endosymbiont of Eucomonympha sp.]